MEKIAIIGTGYVGLVTGVCLAEKNNSVICVDIDSNKIQMLKSGKSPIYEPGLEELLEKNIIKGKITFTDDLEKAIKNSWCIFLCLPTPSDEDGSADLQYVIKASEDIANILSKESDKQILVINKSTVPVGTSNIVLEIFHNKGLRNVTVASNPEFLREGFAINDFMNPDRVVIGTTSEWAKKELLELYLPFTHSDKNILFMDERSAELTKYASNSFLAVKISYMNELSRLCETLDADIDSIRIGMGLDNRIGGKFLFPGIGYGGSCFMPSETVNLAFDNSYRKVSLENLWNELSSEEVKKTENFELINLEKKDYEVLGFDFLNYAVENQKLYYLTRRLYNEKVVAFETKGGRKQLLTLDHPVIYNAEDNVPTLCLAKDIKTGYNIYILDENKISYKFNLDEIAKVEYVDSPTEFVYSVETQNETVITEYGIISHNCFPKDVKAILKTGTDNNIDLSIIKSAMQTNQEQRKFFIGKIDSYLDKLSLKQPQIAIWGISFKPDTDDIREAPSMDIIAHLLSKNILIKAFDPEAKQTGFENNSNFHRTSSLFEATEDADILVICTEWSEFKNVDFQTLKSSMRGSTIIDGRNLWDLQTMKQNEFDYVSIGRRNIKKS